MSDLYLLYLALVLAVILNPAVIRTPLMIRESRDLNPLVPCTWGLRDVNRKKLGECTAAGKTGGSGKPALQQSVGCALTEITIGCPSVLLRAEGYLGLIEEP